MNVVVCEVCNHKFMCMKKQVLSFLMLALAFTFLCSYAQEPAAVFNSTAGPGFSNCKFNYGQDWQGCSHNYPSNINYIRVWL